MDGGNYFGGWFKGHLKNGLDNLKVGKNKKMLLALETVLTVVYILMVYKQKTVSSEMEKIAWRFNVQTYWMVVILVNIVFFLCIGGAVSGLHIEHKLRSIGMKNRVGESPICIGHTYDKKKQVYHFEFLSMGIPLEDWQEHSEDIEAALNILIGEIRQGSDQERIEVWAVSGSEKIPEVVKWKDEICPMDDRTLVCGRGLTKNITVDLSVYPHILIGGSTGSGKTVLLKTLLYQCLMNRMIVIIADFKGGVDYGKYWTTTCKFVTDKDGLKKCLDTLLLEMDARKAAIKAKDARNIDDYNKVASPSEKMYRIIVACDEVAELLDKNGLSKSEKEKTAAIESEIATIARLGRAFGIHLILSTQRPDANIVSGQIKNNCNFRICGRADNVLSQIILDNTDAASEVPKFERGMFLNQDGELFRGFWLEEDKLPLRF